MDNLFLPGSMIYGYRVVSRQESEPGEVYLVRHVALDKPAVLTVLSASDRWGEAERSRFLEEAAAASRLWLDCIALVYDVGNPGSRWLIVTEYVPGEKLAARMARVVPSAAEIVDVGGEIARALEHAHQNGVVHRDLRPDNVVITPTGGTKVLNFGLGWMSESSTGRADVALYRSPEQLRSGPVDHRTDIFSLGAVLCAMATGEESAGRSPAEPQAEFIVRARPDLPRDLAAVIGTSMEPNPERRYQTAKEVRCALDRLHEQTAIRNARNA
jgi:eukaryotic-like serine/threonine-protein kinase